MIESVFDAIVLAGGRSSRLGGTPKAGLTREGETLLGRTVTAVSEARSIIVVGPPMAHTALPAAVSRCRETEEFAGPVAGIAAGLDALPFERGDLLILACDMPNVRDAIPALLAASHAEQDVDALLAHPDGDEPQPLAGLYRIDALSAALAHHETTNRSVRSVLSQLRWKAVPVAGEACLDVDTWEDARRLGWR